jgi:hypothetical protein
MQPCFVRTLVPTGVATRSGILLGDQLWDINGKAVSFLRTHFSIYLPIPRFFSPFLLTLSHLPRFPHFLMTFVKTIS